VKKRPANGLKPYSETNTICKKCDYGLATTEYRHNNGAEYLVRRCGRCKYEWKEACVDAEMV